MAAPSGAAAGAAPGGITGALVGLGIPAIEAKQYENTVEDGTLSMSVHGEDSEPGGQADPRGSRRFRHLPHRRIESLTVGTTPAEDRGHASWSFTRLQIALLGRPLQRLIPRYASSGSPSMWTVTRQIRPSRSRST